MSIKFQPVIEPESLILVTGVTGYIGSHVADQLLRLNYRVRGTSRAPSKSSWITKLFDEKYGANRFEVAEVKDLADEDAFTEAAQGVSGIIHLATDSSLDADPNKVVPTVIAGALNAAIAASKHPSVKRLVYTSSSVAFTAPKPNVELELDIDDWNEEAVKAAWAPPPYKPDRAWIVYSASKTQAEQKLWKFYQEQKQTFALNTILPNANFGDSLSDEQRLLTGEWVKHIYKGNIEAVKALPPQWMVDVNDTARIHIAALLHPDVANERILAFAHPYNWNAVLACLRELFPDKNFAEDTEDEPRDLRKVDNSRGAFLLQEMGQPGWTSFEHTIRDNVKRL